MKKTVSVLSLAAMAGFAACSAKDTGSDSAIVAQQGAGTATASRGTFDPATHTATVYAKDYAFEAPDSVSAGLTTFHLVNEGPNLHHVQLVRLDSGKTFADFEVAIKNPGPPPRWVSFVGGPNAPDPGKTTEAMVDLTEGNYVIVCAVDIPDKVPHFAKGMLRPLTVTAASGPAAAAPAADVTVTMSDYNFVITGELTAGRHVIKVENTGPQPHEIEIARLADGRTMKDFGEWAKTMQGPPPGNAIGGVAGTIPGTTNYVTVDLTPGNYLFICFFPDTKDGKPHVEHGMVKEIAVK
jgi:uncharacterized cupredoxin-like copper-binding protein